MSHFNNSEEVDEDENIKDGKKIVYFLNEKRERERMLLLMKNFLSLPCRRHEQREKSEREGRKKNLFSHLMAESLIRTQKNVCCATERMMWHTRT